MQTWDLAIIAALLLGYAGVSRRIERTVLTAPILFVSAGMALGGEGLGWLRMGISTGAVRALAEATLTLVLFADASRIDLGALRRDLALPTRLLAVGLPLTIAAGNVVAAPLLGGLSWPEALVLGIVLAPTDAALGQAVVTDARLPVRIRQGLNVESGLNDGICVPLLFIALAVAEADEQAITVHHAVRLVIEEIGWGIAGGVAAGAAAAVLLRLVEPRRLVAEHWLPVVPLAGAGLAYGLAVPLGGSGFIAAFVAGLVFGRLYGAHRGATTYLLDSVGLVLSAATFIVFGAIALGPALDNLSGAIILYAVLSLTVVRVAPVALSLVGLDARLPTIGFVGWFGPRGLASIVFAVIVIEGPSLPHAHLLLTAIVATVGLSVYAHGLTALPLTNAYARWFAARAQPLPMESQAAHEHRLRRPTMRA
jgi:sodium/hydrogen antiporter